MGIKNYLIEGGSGTGKTSVATELERRGYDVIHGDRVLAYVGDPETGQALAGPPKGADRVAWRYAHWIWPVDKVRAIAADTTHPATFFCGGSRNSRKFLHLFDKVFVLYIDVETLNRRLDERPHDFLGLNGPSGHWYSATIVLGSIFLPASPSTRQIPSHVWSTISSLTSPEA